MKELLERPLAMVGVTFLLTAAIAGGFPARVCLAVSVALLLSALAAQFLPVFPERGLGGVLLLTAALACFGVFYGSTFRLAPALELAGRTEVISGVVTEVRQSDRFELKTDEGLRVMVYARENVGAAPGQRFTGRLALFRYEDGDSGLSVRRQAMVTPLRGYLAGDCTLESPAGSWLSLKLFGVRQRLSQAFRRRLPGEEGGLLAGMLLGDRGRMEPELRDRFEAAGISHLLAISGYHLAVLAALFRGILRGLRCPRRWASLAVMPLVVFYMAMVGFTPSVARAGIMILMVLAADMLGRESDSLTALGLAALICCVPDPLAASRPGLLYSFAATLSILLFVRRGVAGLEAKLGEARHPKGRRMVLNLLMVSLCAGMATLPLQILFFGEVPLYGLLTNLLAAPLAPVALIAGFFLSVAELTPLAGILAPPFALAVKGSLGLLDGVAGLVSGLPFARLPAAAGFLRVWMIGALALLLAACYRPTPHKRRLAVLLCGVSLLAGCLSYQLCMRGVAQITVVASDGAVAMVVVKDGSAAVLGHVDRAGHAYRVGRVLEEQSVERIELLALYQGTGRQGNEGARALLSEYQVGLALLGPEALADEAVLRAGEGAALAGLGRMEVALWDGDRVEIDSTGMFTEIGGIKTFLLTEECDILSCMRQHGRCDAAVLAGRPGNLDRLRCGLLVTGGVSGGAGADFSARAVVLDGQWDTRCDFWVKAGRMRLPEGTG